MKTFRKNENQHNVKLLQGIIYVMWAIFSIVLVYTLSRIMLNDSFLFLGGREQMKLNLNICIILMVTLILYFFTLHAKISIVLGTGLLLLLDTVNYYIYSFRGTELGIADIYGMRTALNVFGDYTIRPTGTILKCWLVWFVVMALGCGLLPKLKAKYRFASRLFSGLIICFLLIGLVYRGSEFGVSHWSKEGTEYNGYYLNLFLDAKNSYVKKPKGYSGSKAQEVLKDYEKTGTKSKTEDAPTIIAIMNESFTDFRVLGDNFHTNKEVLPYWDSIHKNAVKGYLCSSVYGGGTANSEWEFLTGNSMNLLPAGTIVYQQYLHDHARSIVRNLEENDNYIAMATHPFQSSGWNRLNAWPYLGFQKMTFEEKYTAPDLKTYRGFISDQSMYEYIIRQYKHRDRSKNMFLFGVTMQNHGGYKKKMKEETIKLEGDRKSVV